MFYFDREITRPKLYLGGFILIWPFVMFIKVFRVALIPTDFLLSLGYFIEKSKWESMVCRMMLGPIEKEIFDKYNKEDRTQDATNETNEIDETNEESGETQHIFKKPQMLTMAQVLTKYANLLSSMTGGGRWIILNLRYLSSENFNEVNAIFGKTILAEEIFENIGGILMSIAVIQYCHYYYCYDEGNIGFSIFSLLIAGISLFVETGHYIAKAENWGRGAPVESEYVDSEDIGYSVFVGANASKDSASVPVIEREDVVANGQNAAFVESREYMFSSCAEHHDENHDIIVPMAVDVTSQGSASIETKSIAKSENEGVVEEGDNIDSDDIAKAGDSK